MRSARAVLCALLLVAEARAQTGAKRPGAAAKVQSPKTAGAEDWPVWGGKNRDFIVNTSGLADSWPATGPKKIWTRALGDGYSAIAVENGVLYTAYRSLGRETIVAMNAATGKTIWENSFV